MKIEALADVRVRVREREKRECERVSELKSRLGERESVSLSLSV